MDVGSAGRNRNYFTYRHVIGTDSPTTQTGRSDPIPSSLGPLVKSKELVWTLLSLSSVVSSGTIPTQTHSHF